MTTPEQNERAILRTLAITPMGTMQVANATGLRCEEVCDLLYTLEEYGFVTWGVTRRNAYGAYALTPAGERRVEKARMRPPRFTEQEKAERRAAKEQRRSERRLVR